MDDQTQDPTAAAASEAEAKAPKTPGVGKLIREKLAERATNDEVLAAVREAFPDSSTSTATVSWYRNAMRKEGLDVPTARDLKRERKAAEAPAQEPAAAEENAPEA